MKEDSGMMVPQKSSTRGKRIFTYLKINMGYQQCCVSLTASLLLGALKEQGRQISEETSPHNSAEGTAPCPWSLLTQCQAKGSKGNRERLFLSAPPSHQVRSSVPPARWPQGADGEDAVGAPGARGQVGWQADVRCKQPPNCAFVNKPSHGTRACLLEQQLENSPENHVATGVCRLPALPHSLTFLLPFHSISLSLSH